MALAMSITANFLLVMLSFALFNTSQFDTRPILSLLACSLVLLSIAGSVLLAGVSPS
jgi:hypothetical protein